MGGAATCGEAAVPDADQSQGAGCIPTSDRPVPCLGIGISRKRPGNIGYLHSQSLAPILVLVEIKGLWFI